MRGCEGEAGPDEPAESEEGKEQPNRGIQDSGPLNVD